MVIEQGTGVLKFHTSPKTFIPPQNKYLATPLHISRPNLNDCKRQETIHANANNSRHKLKEFGLQVTAFYVQRSYHIFSAV